MKRFLALTLILFLSACAAPTESPASTPLPPATVEAAASTPTPPAPASAVTQAAPAPQATSRGDKLVASDPATIQVGAGNPVLLEFFRFT